MAISRLVLAAGGCPLDPLDTTEWRHEMKPAAVGGKHTRATYVAWTVRCTHTYTGTRKEKQSSCPYIILWFMHCVLCTVCHALCVRIVHTHALKDVCFVAAGLCSCTQLWEWHDILCKTCSHQSTHTRQDRD